MTAHHAGQPVPVLSRLRLSAGNTALRLIGLPGLDGVTPAVDPADDFRPFLIVRVASIRALVMDDLILLHGAMARCGFSWAVSDEGVPAGLLVVGRNNRLLTPRRARFRARAVGVVSFLASWLLPPAIFAAFALAAWLVVRSK